VKQPARGTTIKRIRSRFIVAPPNVRVLAITAVQ
jgi:hypothetical protein